jgi:hypothetical protein
MFPFSNKFLHRGYLYSKENRNRFLKTRKKSRIHIFKISKPTTTTQTEHAKNCEAGQKWLDMVRETPTSN